VRRLGTLAVLALAGSGAFVASGAGGSSGQVRVDAIFDNVSFLNKGQQVRIAGATVGKVIDLKVTPDNKARVQMKIDKEWAPFRSDADCVIQPQSLIGEKFIQCTPGTPDAGPLEGDVPTVPVTRTHSPVDLDLVLSTFDLPARERLSILLGSLGAGLAGRGDDLNAAIRRANPALQETKQVLDIIDSDRARLQGLIRDGDTVLTALAKRRQGVAAFVRETGTVAKTAGDRAAAVAEGTRRLPRFLEQAQPALDRLTEFAKAGTPLLADLERSGPSVADLTQQVGTFSGQSAPALAALRPALKTVRQAVPDVEPQLERVAKFAAPARQVGSLLAALLDSSRDAGVFEGIGQFLYYSVAATARFDKNGHMIPAYAVFDALCGMYAYTPAEPRCSAHFDSAKAAKAAGSSTVTNRAGVGGDVGARAPATQLPDQTGKGSPDPTPTSRPSAGAGGRSTVADLLDFLLGK
jgi:virulence factor Mce-like protein